VNSLIQSRWLFIRHRKAHRTFDLPF